MVSQIHDDDTDYSDLDDHEAPTPQRPSGPKNRERLNERTPLLSSSPPPPTYSDVTRLYGTPPYGPQQTPHSSHPHQTHHDASAEPRVFGTNQPQSMGDPTEDIEDGKRSTKERRAFTNFKTLACLLLILTASILALIVIKVKHNSNTDIGDGKDHHKGTSPPTDTFPHLSGCNYDFISDLQMFGFDKPNSFSFVEVTEGSTNPSSRVNGHIRILPAPDDQEDPIMTGLRVAKSSEAHDGHFSIEYTPESLRINTPAYTLSHSKACIEVEITIWIKHGAKLEHLEIATEHLDIKVEPGLFPLCENDGASKCSDDAHYVSNTTDFFAVAGDVSVAYWESGRNTGVDLVSGNINGRFALKDVLFLRTQSGNIDVNVEPKPVCLTNPKPAEYRASTKSGNIRTIFPLSGTAEDIPDRIYHTKVQSGSGSISGNYIHGLSTDLSTNSGSIDINVLPYSANNSGSWFRTESQGGTIKVDMLPSFVDPDTIFNHMRSMHKTRSGSLHMRYPQQWEGKIEAVTMTGNIGLYGKDVRVVKVWKGPVGAHVVAQKGSESSTMDLESSSGSIEATIGDRYKKGLLTILSKFLS